MLDILSLVLGLALRYLLSILCPKGCSLWGSGLCKCLQWWLDIRWAIEDSNGGQSNMLRMHVESFAWCT